MKCCASFKVQTCSFIFLRGSLGFGEEALQSLPGKVGSQVLTVTTSCNLVFAYCASGA